MEKAIVLGIVIILGMIAILTGVRFFKKKQWEDLVISISCIVVLLVVIIFVGIGYF